MQARIILAAFLAASFNSAQAGTLSFTGAELFSNPNVSFPTTQPTLNGSSLVFGTGSVQHGKLMTLPLIPSGGSPTTITVSMNLTRLACISSCAGASEDHDPIVFLGDGVYLIGAQYADPGHFFGQVHTDQGNSGNRIVHNSISDISAFPSIGDAFDISTLFELDNSMTTVTVEDNDFLSSSQFLNPTAEISFVFSRNNDLGEQYQINSLTISGAGIVPLPPAVWLFGSALGLLGWLRRKAR